jgi:hypothetical protein
MEPHRRHAELERKIWGVRLLLIKRPEVTTQVFLFYPVLLTTERTYTSSPGGTALKLFDVYKGLWFNSVEFERKLE